MMVSDLAYLELVAQNQTSCKGGLLFSDLPLTLLEQITPELKKELEVFKDFVLLPDVGLAQQVGFDSGVIDFSSGGITSISFSQSNKVSL